MDPVLSEALKNPTMVISAGTKPADKRPSINWAQGLRRLGAAVMIGAALLSPINSVSAHTAHLAEQRVEQAIQVEATAGPSAMGQRAATSGGELRAQAGGNESAAGDRKPSYSSWSPRPDEYSEVMRHMHKDLKKGKEISQWRWDYHSNTLLTDAYHEISAGHSVENPSGRLLDICRQIQKVDQEMPGFNSHQHADVTFQTCNAEGMAKEIRTDSIKKFAVAAPVLGGLLAVKGIASAAQLGSGLYLAGMLNGGLADRRRERNALKGQPSQDQSAAPKPPSLG